MAPRTAPLCKDCGHHHWNIVRCDGTHKGAAAAIEKERERRQDIVVREKIDMPPLPTGNDGFRPFGDRLTSWDKIGNGTLIRKGA